MLFRKVYLFVPMTPPHYFILALPENWGRVWNRDRKKITLWRFLLYRQKHQQKQMFSNRRWWYCSQLLNSDEKNNTINTTMHALNEQHNLKRKAHTHPTSQMYSCMHVVMSTEWSDVCSWKNKMQERKIWDLLCLGQRKNMTLLINQPSVSLLKFS